MAVISKPVPTTMALSSTTKLVDAAAALSRLSEASEDGGHEKARDSPSADPSPPAAEPIPAKPTLTAKHLVTPTISPSDPKPKPVPTPPVPDPPATRLLRTLLGDAVPPEPPTSTTSGLATTAWWRRVVEALYNHKRRQTVRLLDSLQREALRAVSKKASASSEEAIPELWESFTSMGLSDADVRLALAWILAAAPIIIHVNLSKTLKHFLKDTHYRNQFETGTSRGKLCQVTRTRWENDMFDDHYAEATPFQRVKYGVISVAGAGTGVERARNYGHSYFELNNDVRLRCTFGHGDSGNNKHCVDDLGVCEAYAHVMLQWSEETTKHIVAVARKVAERLQQQDASSSRIPSEEDSDGGSSSSEDERWIYKPTDDPAAVAAALPLRHQHPPAGVLNQYQEMQVHGPVALANDIARLVVHRSSHEGDAEMVKRLRAFGEKFGVPVVWMDEGESV